MVFDKIGNKWVLIDETELGHMPGYEFYYMRNHAESIGMTQTEFNDFMNNPNYYAWQYISDNRSRIYETSH